MGFTNFLATITLGSLSLASLPTTLDAAIDELLEVPAISQAIPDDIEAWIQDIEIGAKDRSTNRSGSGSSEPAPTASSGGDEGTTMSRNGRTSKTSFSSLGGPDKTTVSTRPTTEDSKVKPLEREISESTKQAMPGADAPTRSPAPPPMKRPGPTKTPTTDRAPSATKTPTDTTHQPFGQWVKEQTHSGVKGRDLAEAIKTEKARRGKK